MQTTIGTDSYYLLYLAKHDSYHLQKTGRSATKTNTTSVKTARASRKRRAELITKRHTTTEAAVASWQDSIAPQLKPVVEARAPVGVGLVHHAPSALRYIRVLGSKHQALLETLESGVSHVLEARELRLEGER